MVYAPVLKYPGSKWSIATWIISQMPPHKTYLEPFLGSGAVFFQKAPSLIETINDIDENVTNFFTVLRDSPIKLARLIELTPWARKEYESILTTAGDECYFKRTGDPLEDARRFLIRMWQGMGSKTSDRTSWRNKIQAHGQSSDSIAWSKLPQILIDTAKRLKMAYIENQPAVTLIKRYAFPEVLIYADPPYPLSTRSRRMYANEMTDEDHIHLLDVLEQHPGPVLLSGYVCDLYTERLKHWTIRTIKARAEGGRERKECLWLNPVASQTQKQMTIFL